jgi:phosphopantetheinyl transferase
VEALPTGFKAAAKAGPAGVDAQIARPALDWIGSGAEMSTEASAKKILAAGPADFGPRAIPLDRQALPGAGSVHVWFLDLADLARPLRGALDGHVGPRDPAPFTPGQLRFARWFYLRLLLGAYLGIPGKAVKINRSVRGKPTLDASAHPEELHFSMAKSGDCLLVGFSAAAAVGVDLEQAGRRAHDALGVARRYFSPPEAAALAALEAGLREECFLRTWACKEAVVKASGQGIANQLCRFTVETDLARPAAMLDFDGQGPGDWSLALLCPDPAYLGAVAGRGRGLRVEAFRLLPGSPS